MTAGAPSSLPSPSALELPASAGDWEPWLSRRGAEGLRDAGEQVLALKSAPLGDAAALQLWNDAGIALGNVFAVSSLLSQVHPDPAVVERAETLEVEARRFSTDLMLDPDVFERLESLDRVALDADATRVLDDALRDFRRAGVDRSEEDRTRLRAMDEEMTSLGQAFSRNIRDGRRTTLVPAAALAGLPEDFVEEHPADADGSVAITTEYPDTQPFLTFARDASARREVLRSFFDLGYPDNEGVLASILRLRREKAQLLGYASWPDYDAEVKMIGTGDAIAAFIDQIAADAEASGERDLAVLLERARQDDPGTESVDVANWRYLAELVRRERFDVDAQAVRRYFDFERVRQGLLDVTGRLFGLRYTRVESPTWHADVATYDVILDAAHGAVIGRIHLDLHPRERKYNHAAQFDLVPGVRGRQLPEGVLVCNFPRGLMEHQQVVTLFHEFGHLMHHVLAGAQDWVRFSGVATEWDFVEAPSQMLEEWAWDAEVLQGFATDAAGTAIPRELVTRMREAEELGKGFLARTQMFYAAMSYRLHLEVPEDITGRMFELYDRYSQVRPLPDTHFFAGFGHLEGYTSAYYTYMWSQVIAKDMFSAFDPEDLFAPEVASRYRDRVLVPGGSRDAADLVADFLGRPYSSEAFKQWLER